MNVLIRLACFIRGHRLSPTGRRGYLLREWMCVRCGGIYVSHREHGDTIFRGDESSDRIFQNAEKRTFAANALPAGMRGMVSAVNVALIDAEGAGNGEGAELALADRWFQVSPYGEWTNEVGLQRFDEQAANEIVSNFNGLSQTIGRHFRGLPIFVGHPDHDPKEYPDRRRFGSIVELQARPEGLFARPKWNEIGRTAVNDGHFVYQSPFWGMREIASAGDQKTFRPVLLESVGLTNNPNIPGLPVGANEKKTADPNQLNPMTKEALIKKFNLQPLEGQTEVSDAQIEAAVDAALTAPIGVRAALAGKLGLKPKEGGAEFTDDDFTGAFAGLRTNVAQVADARDAVLLEGAVNEGKITAAEKPGWKSRLQTDFANASKALKELTPAINTRQGAALTADLGARNGGAAGSASEQFTLAVNERVAKGEPFDAAWSACKATHKSLYEQMQAPKGLAS